jgi:hypothetical protein
MEPRKLEEFDDTAMTPGWLREFVHANFPVTYEPEDANALIQPWHGFVFAHPPHEESQLWCEKAAKEAAQGVFSVLLLPAVFNSIYWRQTVLPQASEIRVLTCPLKKPGAKKQIVSQMAFVVFAGKNENPEPQIFVVEPDGWEERYYKRPRNKARFTVKK